MWCSSTSYIFSMHNKCLVTSVAKQNGALSLHGDRLTYNLTFKVYQGLEAINIFLIVSYIWALWLGEMRGQNCSRLSCPLVREADSRLRVKGYGWAWRGGWTPCLSPVALLIFMFLVVTSLLI